MAHPPWWMDPNPTTPGDSHPHAECSRYRRLVVGVGAHEDPVLHHPAGLVLGTAQLVARYGLANFSGPMDEQGAASLLRKAEEAGVLALDTAPGYGSAESVIGSAGVATPVFTKLDPVLKPDESVGRSLNRLGRSKLELLQVHDQAQLWDGHVLDELSRLVGHRLMALGASVYDVEAFDRVMADGRFDYVQVPLSVADQRLSGAPLVAAQALDRKVLVRSVFLQGALLLDQHALPDHLSALAPVLAVLDALVAATGRSRQDLLIGFVRELPGVAGVIIGCETADQLEQIIRAFRSAPLPRDAQAALGGLPPLPVEVLDPRRWPVAFSAASQPPGAP